MYSLGHGLTTWTRTGCLTVLMVMNVGGTLGWLCCMVNNNNFSTNSRAPPVWAPDMEPQHTCADWQRDVLLRTITNEDMEPPRQAAVLLQALRGGARQLIRIYLTL